MRKKFILKNEGTLCLTVEELLRKFEKTLYEFGHSCEESFSYRRCNAYNNVYAFEDYVQIASIELVKAFEEYDFEKGFCFSTLFYSMLANRQVMIARELKAAKRNLDQPAVSLDADTEHGNTTGEMLFGVKDVIVSDKEGLEEFLCKNLTEKEKSLLVMAYQKKLPSAKAMQKRNLSYFIDALNEGALINVIGMRKHELADILNISRPTLNKQIKESEKKLMMLTERYLGSTNV